MEWEEGIGRNSHTLKLQELGGFLRCHNWSLAHWDLKRISAHETFNSKCLMALLDVLLMLSLKMGCLLTMMAKAGLFKWFNFPDYIGEAFDLANPTHIPIIPANS